VQSVFLIYTQGVFAFYDLPEHLSLAHISFLQFGFRVIKFLQYKKNIEQLCHNKAVMIILNFKNKVLNIVASCSNTPGLSQQLSGKKGGFNCLVKYFTDWPGCGYSKM
jgi:hypothetical protein